MSVMSVILMNRLKPVVELIPFSEQVTNNLTMVKRELLNIEAF